MSATDGWARILEWRQHYVAPGTTQLVDLTIPEVMLEGAMASHVPLSCDGRELASVLSEVSRYVRFEALYADCPCDGLTDRIWAMLRPFRQLIACSCTTRPASC